MKKFKYSEITPEKIYNNRRTFLKNLGYGIGSIAFANNALANTDLSKPTSYKDITTYNNYYEFGTGKGDPYKKSQDFKTRPWNVRIEGGVEEPIDLSIDEILNSFSSEERVQRLRCVEGWSMIIPWMG